MKSAAVFEPFDTAHRDDASEIPDGFQFAPGCAGGTVKDWTIEIQGDHRDKLVAELQSRGFTVKRK